MVLEHVSVFPNIKLFSLLNIAHAKMNLYPKRMKDPPKMKYKKTSVCVYHIDSIAI